MPVHGNDELAQLARTFNTMAEQLGSIEASRRQWLGDVAHELRTPLAAMRAEIEAVQDGIRPFDDKTALRLHRPAYHSAAGLASELAFMASLRDRGLAVPEPIPASNGSVWSLKS